MKKLIFSVFLLGCLLFVPAMVLGQRTITGKITDSETGEGMPGATIIVVDLFTGTYSDGDGNYSIALPEGYDKLRVTYVGYAEVEQTVGSSNELNFTMKPGTTLDEVMVIGYGKVKKEDATGAIQTVGEEFFNQGAITGPQELLAGKIAGVQIVQGSDPGGGAAIRIRGGSSLSASNDPLIVIDGVPVANDGISGARNPLNIVNPNDIETFTVLKDASATAIYGSRASNGVILITTKKGALGKKIKVNYNGNFAVSNTTGKIDVLNGDEYRALITDQFGEGHPAVDLLGTANTDWQDQIYQTGIQNDHNINVSGGIGAIPYRVSVGYTNKSGVLKTDGFNRGTAAINLSPGFLDNRLQINFNLKSMLTANQFANRGAIGSAVRFDPTQEIMDEGNPYGGYYTWTQPNGNPNPIAPANPVALLNQRDDQSDVTRHIISGQIDYRFGFLPSLRANLNLGYDVANGEGSVNVPIDAAFQFADTGLTQIYWQNKRNELLDFYLNYTEEFGDLDVDVMGGYSWQHFFRQSYSYGTNVAGTKIIQPEDTNTREYYLVSLFGRANLTFKDRYLFTFTLRQDGTSRFGPENRFGLFPAAALGVKIIDDQPGAVNNIKLRLGYGVTGQQDIGGDFYPYLARYLSSFPNAQYQFGNQFYTTLRPNGYDANIKWEETTTYNVGIDYAFLDNRISGAIEYYQRYTTDLLNFIPVPAGTNLTNFITTNVGDLENKGFEFSVNAIPYENKENNAFWEIGLNMTLNRNKITRLTATEDPNYQGVFTGGISGGVGNTIQIHSVGYPANSFFVYSQVYDEAGIPIEGLFEDLNGDGQITPDDRYRFENPAPDVFFGLTSLFSYKDFEFSFAGRANLGNYMYNNVLSDGGNYNGLYNSTNFLGNIHGDYQSIDFSVPQYLSDHYIVDASFFRLDNVTAAYNFRNIMEGSNNIRVSLTAQNVFVITNYPGLDPEIFGGIDNNFYPRSRTILLGVNANF
jgi:iron complex outermembrane receptor protein